MMFDAHWHGFRVFEGIPGRGIYDNMKTAVDRIGVGKKRDVNARFLSMTSHYVFEPEFCNPAAGWGKPLVRHWFKPNGSGQVEKNVRDARHRLWQVMRYQGAAASSDAQPGLVLAQLREKVSAIRHPPSQARL